MENSKTNVFYVFFDMVQYPQKAGLARRNIEFLEFNIRRYVDLLNSVFITFMVDSIRL